MAIAEDANTDMRRPGGNSEEDVDDVLAALEDEDDSEYRKQRAHELSNDAVTVDSKPVVSVSKAYLTLQSDDEVLQFTTEHERSVVHFLHPDFARCAVMDDHCSNIAGRHAEFGTIDVSFARVDVKNAPFVVEKLNIRVLPCVVGFINGVIKGRITGFEGVCWDGKENGAAVTIAIEQNLVDWSILQKRLFFGYNEDQVSDDEDDTSSKQRKGRRGIRDRKQKNEDENDDWD